VGPPQIGAALELVLLPLFAMLSDRIGRRPVALFGAALTAGGAFPFFALVQSGTFVGVTAAICLAMVGISALYAVIPAYISELFSARVRYSGISASYTIASGLIGGFSPAIGTGLYAWAQGTWPVALYLVAVGLISLVCIWLGRGSTASAATLPQTMPAPVSSYP